VHSLFGNESVEVFLSRTSAGSGYILEYFHRTGDYGQRISRGSDRFYSRQGYRT
jgi:hypothetical protein